MKTRIITGIILIVYSILLKKLLLALFPFPGPGAIASVPMGIILGVILAIINFILLPKIIVLWKRVLYFFTLFIGFTYITFESYPEEEALSQIIIACKLYANPNEIKYEDLFRLNYHKEAVYVTAALVKYKDSIPDQAFNIRYCCADKVKYYIAKYSNTYLTNNKHLVIDRLSKKDTVLFKDVFEGKNVEFSYPSDVFSNKEGWGRFIDEETRENTIDFQKCSFKPLDGFNKIYYDFLIKNYR